ncbi:hypothetical protein [Candidatus Enterococcus mansonii]|uniref:Lipoprotein n=1 Tax=Candidatus Enterococcus mansonii TaxID=1834181 RepID=A0A242CIC5_9ENTE|nr:hypothetical protein [Enterococcus sp. 4G2_DIV0659]OTO09532.1 hypothetical protein A5880_000211 [Enterococcus sp. 4G2_DIV0659]
MKMKKYVLAVFTGIAIFLLAACGSDPRKEFAKEMMNANGEQYNAASFKMKIDDLTYDGDQGGAYVKMFASQLKDVTIDGKYAYDEKAEALELEVTANVLGEKLPIQLVSKKDKMYMSTSFVSGALDLANSFGYPIELSKSELNKLKGKYIDIAEAGDTLSSGKLDQKNPLKDKELTNVKDSKMGKELIKLIESFDKKSFKKDKDVLTHTFTKTEIIQMLEKMDEVAKEDKDYKKSGNAKEIKDAIKTFKKDIEKMDLKVSINQKTKAVDTKLSMSANNKSDDSTVGMVMTISVTPQKNKKEINVPSKKEIISEDELNKIFSSMAPAETDETTSDEFNTADDYANFDDLKDNPELQKVIDEQLNEMIKQIEENPEMVTEESVKEFREKVKDIFTDEQMKKLNEALDKALKGETV